MKELRRSRTNRMIAGVCGGIGEGTLISPTVIRLIWVIVTVFTVGIGVLAYLLAVLVIPEEGAARGWGPGPSRPDPTRTADRSPAAPVGGIVGAVVSAATVARRRRAASEKSARWEELATIRASARMMAMNGRAGTVTPGMAASRP